MNQKGIINSRIVLGLLFVVLVLSPGFAAAGTADLVVSLSHYEPVPLNPGNEFDVWLQVENIGDEPAEQLQFEVLSSLPFYLAPSEDAATNPRTIQARGVSLIPYTLRVQSDAEEGDYYLYYRYKSKSTSRWTPGQVKLSVKTQDANLVIESVSFEDEQLLPGQVSPVTFTIQNAADSPLRNIRMQLDLQHVIGDQGETLPFTPLGGTDEKVLYTLGAGETHSFIYKILVDPDAASGPYKIPVQLMYQDDAENNYTKNLITGFLIDAKPDLLTLIDEVTQMGDTYDITVRFINKGFIDLKLFEAEIEDEMESISVLSGERIYVGDVDSDDYETVTMRVRATPQDGSFVLPVTVRYYTANNELFEETRELVIKQSFATQTQSGRSGTVWFVIIVLVLGGLIFYRHRKKKQREQELRQKSRRK